MHIDYSVRGEGEPLVLIHGLFGTRENLGAIAKHFSDSYTVYSIDLPNHGRSEHTSTCTLAELANSVSKWMKDIELRSAHFFGHSLGGKVAMELALSYPEKVDQLVVADIAPVRYTHRHQQVFAGLLAINISAITSRTEAESVLAKYVQEKAVRSFLLKNLQRGEAGQFYWRMNLVGLEQSYPDIISANREDRFQRPVLFLKAENSDYIQEKHREDILARFPQAQLKVVSNTGHWLHAEKPELIARLSKRFFDI